MAPVCCPVTSAAPFAATHAATEHSTRLRIDRFILGSPNVDAAIAAGKNHAIVQGDRIDACQILKTHPVREPAMNGPSGTWTRTRRVCGDTISSNVQFDTMRCVKRVSLD